jgi:hypothetical protein
MDEEKQIVKVNEQLTSEGICSDLSDLICNEYTEENVKED